MTTEHAPMDGGTGRPTNAMNLQDLSLSGDYYITAIQVYRRASGWGRLWKVIDWMKEHLPALVDSLGALVGDGGVNMLSVGAGCGLIDSKILHHFLESVHPKIRAVVMEPDSHMMHQYKDLVSKESTRLQGVDFDWRQQTFQEYQATAKEEDKFHFISCISAIYYCGDLEKSLKFLYEKLDSGGVLLITIMSADSGSGKLWQYLSTNLGREGKQLISTDIQDACHKVNIPIQDIQTIKTYCDISSCFEAPPHQLTKDGNILLDFLTHTVNFAQNVPAKIRDDVLRLLGSPECSVTGPEGQVNLDASNSVFIIQR